MFSTHFAGVYLPHLAQRLFSVASLLSEIGFLSKSSKLLYSPLISLSWVLVTERPSISMRVLARRSQEFPWNIRPHCQYQRFLLPCGDIEWNYAFVRRPFAYTIIKVSYLSLILTLDSAGGQGRYQHPNPFHSRDILLENKACIIF